MWVDIGQVYSWGNSDFQVDIGSRLCMSFLLLKSEIPLKAGSVPDPTLYLSTTYRKSGQQILVKEEGTKEGHFSLMDIL